jgi:lysophospholipase L1-like esterase
VRGLQNVSTLSDVVGPHYLSPPSVGPRVSGYSGAVIGDSRAARVGGPPVANGAPEDGICQRSSDSLAAQVGAQLPARVLNLACSGASVATGLRGPLVRGGAELPPQVGRLKQVEGLKFVVVVIGPNDLSWTDFIKYCYGVDNCSDNLTEGEFTYRLAAFDQEYGNLLHDLNELPSRPQVIVVTSYYVFPPDANCWDARGPAEAKGLNADKIGLLTNRNTQLNDVLTGGAKKYGFDVAHPPLAALCTPTTKELGPDLQGLTSGDPFHPTAVGELRMASSVARLIRP